MAKPLLVKNLPPHITVDEIRKAFSPYGPIHEIYLPSDYYLNNYYPLDSAYLYFEEGRSCDFFLEDNIDVVIDGFFTEVVDTSVSKEVTSTAVIYGISQSVTIDDLFYALRLDGNSEIEIKKPGSRQNDGFAFVTFTNDKFCQSFLLSFTEITVGNCTMAVRQFPQPKSPKKAHHTATLSCAPSSFIRLRNFQQFQDFTISIPSQNKKYKLSSKILAASSRVIADLISTYPYTNHFVCTIEGGNYDEFFDALYGKPLEITSENCEFIHAVASQLDIPDLIGLAGAVAYDKLSLYNYDKILYQLIQNNLNYDYVIDFIASHLSEGLQDNQEKTISLIDLSPDVLKKVANHHLVQSMSVNDVGTLFKNVLLLGKLKLSDISQIDNDELDLNSNRQLLIDYLDNKLLSQVSSHHGQDSVQSNDNSEALITNPGILDEEITSNLELFSFEDDSDFDDLFTLDSETS
ncbi:hypothetical protein TRFO_28916 [Tritrichomonas foetus]|uniref:RRM domain-containing protein n=1 Tax=Tritrichomonas foetus TaxID=1144522 RepID=A0A1J4JWY2_9EUKA|nr:hypothetical protein TRFO_28916 [Tritrichomonas foetus]|eukprot:OHT03655.1 hypothetical protein TRFO_28916 [Tritrichomonas foetus]